MEGATREGMACRLCSGRVGVRAGGRLGGASPLGREGHASRACWELRDLYTSGAYFQKLTLVPRPSLGARRRASRGQRLGGDFVVSRNSLSLPNTKWGVGGLLTTHSYTIPGIPHDAIHTGRAASRPLPRAALLETRSPHIPTTLLTDYSYGHLVLSYNTSLNSLLFTKTLLT